MAGIRFTLTGGSITALRVTSGTIDGIINGASTARLRLVRPVTAADLAATGSPFTITSSDGATRFVGHVLLPSRAYTPGAQIQEITLVDRWHRELEQYILTAATPWGIDSRVLLGGQQLEYTSAESEASPIDPEEVYTFDGWRLEADATLGETVARIVAGVTGSKSIALTGSRIIPRWVDGITRAQAVRDCLRWLGGAAAWFAPDGSFHANATAPTYSVDVTDCGRDGIKLARRADLAVPGIRIIFRKWVEGIGRVRQPNVIQSSGDPDAPGGIITSIDLSPERHSLSASAVRVRTVEGGSVDWWAAISPEIAKLKDEPFFIGPQNVTVQRMRRLRESESEGTATAGGEVADAAITAEILTGTIPQTFVDIGCTGPYGRRAKVLTSGNTRQVKTGRIIVEADFVLVPTGRSVRLRYTANACDLPGSGVYVYEDKTAFDPGEYAAEFAGIAEAYMAAINTRQWQGTVTLAPQASGGMPVSPIGRLLRVTGGNEEWSTMDARISGVTQDLAARTTTLTVGPTPGVELGDLVERIRAFRDARHRPRRLVDADDADYRGAVEALQSPGESPGNSTDTARVVDNAPFALNPRGIGNITLNPSTVYDHLPTGMHAVTGTDISVSASTGVVWIRVTGTGASSSAITIHSGTEWPTATPSVRIIKLGGWTRAIDPVTGLIALKTENYRYGPIDREATNEPTLPFSILADAHESTGAAQVKVLGSTIDGEPHDEWIITPTSGTHIIYATIDYSGTTGEVTVTNIADASDLPEPDGDTQIVEQIGYYTAESIEGVLTITETHNDRHGPIKTFPCRIWHADSEPYWTRHPL